MIGQSKRVISYSIFGSRTIPKEDRWLFNTYMRGLYFNVCMNALIYPDWISHVEVDSGTFMDHDNFFIWLADNYGMTYNINVLEPRCKAMLWRLKPIWNDTDIVLCRDSDAITTWREKTAVYEWLTTTDNIHGINDNEAHGLPMMGGMVGFRAKAIRDHFKEWDALMFDNEEISDMKLHGSDQTFLMKVIYPHFKGSFYLSDELGRLSPHNNPLWESDLCSRHIGSAGIVEMETIRFFRRRNLEKVGVFAKRYPEIFSWV